MAWTVAGLAVLLLAQPAGATSDSDRSGSAQRTVTVVKAELSDLAVDQDDAFDGAYAYTRIVSYVGSDGSEQTRAKLWVWGVDADEGTQFGSHVHVGPCIEGDGDAAGPHFNITTSRGEETQVSPETEIWLDLTVDKRGRGRSRSDVTFTIPSGEAQSIVIHELPTDPSGGAGPRLACIPI